MQTLFLISQSCDFCGSEAGREETVLLQEFSPIATVSGEELETPT